MWNGRIGIWIYKQTTKQTRFGHKHTANIRQKVAGLLLILFRVWLKFVVVLLSIGRPVLLSLIICQIQFNLFLKIRCEICIGKTEWPNFTLHSLRPRVANVFAFLATCMRVRVLFSLHTLVRFRTRNKHSLDEQRRECCGLNATFFIRSIWSFDGRLKVKSNHWNRSTKNSKWKCERWSEVFEKTLCYGLNSDLPIESVLTFTNWHAIAN